MCQRSVWQIGSIITIFTHVGRLIYFVLFVFFRRNGRRFYIETVFLFLLTFFLRCIGQQDAPNSYDRHVCKRNNKVCFFSIGAAQDSVVFSGTILKMKQLTDVCVQPTWQVLVCTDFMLMLIKSPGKSGNLWRNAFKCIPDIKWNVSCVKLIVKKRSFHFFTKWYCTAACVCVVFSPSATEDFPATIANLSFQMLGMWELNGELPTQR